MILKNNIKINFELNKKIYEATIKFNTEEEENAIYNAFDGYTLETYEEGEVTISMSQERYGYTKKEFISELRKAIKKIRR